MEKKFFCANNVSFSYYRSPLFLNNVSFFMDKYDKILILATKDMGKTTFLSVMSSFENDYLGKILFEGEELKTIADGKKNFSFLPSKPVFFENKTILYNIKFLEKTLNKNFQENDLTKVLEKYNLLDCLNKKVKKLTLFEQRKLALARSELKSPNILFLDNQLDNLSQDEKLYMFENYKRVLSNQSSSVIFALDDENYNSYKKELKSMNITKILYLVNSNLFEFKNINEFENDIKNVNQIMFIDEYCYQTKAIIYRQNDNYYLNYQDQNFLINSKYYNALSALKLNDNDEEDVVILYKNSDYFDNLSDQKFNDSLSEKIIMIFSNIDGSKIL